MRKRLVIAVAVAAVVFAASLAFAQAPGSVSVVVPNALTSVEGASNNFLPFSEINRYQQVLSASQFSRPLLITQIRLRADAIHGTPDSASIASIRIDLSTTAAREDALSMTFADNVGANNTTVFSGPLTLVSALNGPPGGPMAFDYVINLQVPFSYYPGAGNLLLDVRNFSGASAYVVFDAQVAAGDGTSRIATYDVMASSALPGDADTLGLVVQFVGTPIPPAPGPDLNQDRQTDIVWRNRVTGELAVWLMNGSSVGSEVPFAGPTDPGWRLVAAADFNGDGATDLVMRHATSGEDQVWYMNGTTHTSTVALPTIADTRWQIAAAVDFNLDGQTDLLWRNSANGDVVVWYLTGGVYIGWDLTATIKDPTWVMAGVGDFNDDGKPDIMWHNAHTGENLVWYMNGAAYAGWALLPTEADTNWTIVAVTDYNGDGRPDLLWRNTVTGANRVWRLGTGPDTLTAPPLLGTDTLPAVTDLEREVAGAEAGRTRPTLSDFNADGHPDILWHNDATGESRLWYMAGSKGDTRLAEMSIGIEADVNWKTVAVADFNQDGLPDIVWRHSATGQNKIALMTGRTKTGEMTLPTIPDANWKIVGVGDFDQDGHPDLAWRNYLTGDNIIWFLKNGVYVGWTAPPTITDTNWKIVAVGDFNGDGWPDLFWRNSTTGENIAWFLLKGVYVGWGAPPTISDPAWQIVGAGDYNADGKADLLWRNATTGENLLWYLIDGQYAGWAALPTLDVAWKTGAGQ